MATRHHIDELQALRGMAALVVVVSHMSWVYPLSRPLHITIDCLFNAHASVIIFFVLSGYVLTGSIMRRGLSWNGVAEFYLARLFRLLPALWVATAISALFLLAAPGTAIHPASTFWFFLYLHAFPSAGQVALAAIAVDRALIMPVWTIFIEFIGSAIMPFMVAIACTRLMLFRWILLGMVVMAYVLAYAPHRLNALTYLLDFALGVWLASRPFRMFASMPLRTLGVSTLILVFFRFAWFSIRSRHWMPLYDYDAPIPMLVESFAAFCLIGSLASEHGRVRLLRTRWSIWLGNASYSLYLIHFPVAILVVKLLSFKFTDSTSAVRAMIALMAIGLPASLLLASLVYHWIEIPAISLGKTMVKRLAEIMPSAKLLHAVKAKESRC